MKLLLLFPNAANWATISTAIPILSGIAKSRAWNVEYFDTYNYKKGPDSSTEKEKSGGFKPGFSILEEPSKPYSSITLDLQNKIDEFQPDLIAITALSHEYEFLMKFLPNIQIPVETKVVIGGIHMMLTNGDPIETKLFDIVVLGEAEETFDLILSKLESNESLKGLDGTCLYDKVTGEIIRHPKRKLLTNEELWKTELDFTFYSDAYFVRPFDGKQIRRYDVDTTRGCPYNCNYCGNSALKAFHKGLGTFIKTRPITSAIELMMKIKEDFKIDIFQFTDECFLSHPLSWITKFMDRYIAEVKKPYILQTRAETITEEKIDLLLSYGTPFQVSIGVESGSDHILNDLCNRKCTKDQIIKTFNVLNERRIRTNAFFMIGFPFEKREDVFSTIELCRTIKPSVASVSIFQPLPGQEITKLCIENGFITGKEQMATFTSHSLLNMPKPYLSGNEIHNLWRTFMLYSSLPKEDYGDIEKCEMDIESHQQLYDTLIMKRWKQFDYAKSKGDLSMI